jgi:hypothetical protein
MNVASVHNNLYSFVSLVFLLGLKGINGSYIELFKDINLKGYYYAYTKKAKKEDMA